MQQAEAVSLIQKAITGDQTQNWVDLGCGTGTFTLALQSLLPIGSHLSAVDKRPQKLPVGFIKADFEKDDLHLAGLDGILMANSLHYVRDKAKLIKKLEIYFSASPAFLIVEYDITRYSPWIPYPINYQNLQKLFTGLGYSSITKLAEAPSQFGGRMYSALIRL
jgi:hypothetical protein